MEYPMNNTTVRRLAYLVSLATILAFSLLGRAALAQDAGATNLCGQKLRVAFVNGMSSLFTTQTGGEIDRDALRDKLEGSGRLPAPATYTHYYNAQDGVMRDLFEVLVQKLDEGATFRGHYELIGYFLQGGDPSVFPSWVWQVLGVAEATRTALDAFGELAGYLADPAAAFLSDALNELALAAANDLIVQPELAAARARVLATTQKLSLDLSSDLSSGYNVLIVPHSQGNLYANRVYDSVAASGAFQDFANRVRVVHVAVPSSTTAGRPYTTARQDRVIGLLRVLAPSTLPGTHDVSTGDWLRHGFRDTYLADDSPTQSFIVDESVAALTALNSTPTTGSRGYFWVTTTWNIPGDIDLHVFEPGGSHVYYANMHGASGYLDRDDIPGTGPEHYYATCNATDLELGTYTVKINNYNGSPGTVVDVALNMLNSVVSRQVSLTVGEALQSSGNANPPYPAFTVQVSKDAQGNYLVTSL
jgi:hypothetical protein